MPAGTHRSLSLSLSLSHTHTLSLSHAHTHTLSLSRSLSLSLSHLTLEAERVECGDQDGSEARERDPRVRGEQPPDQRLHPHLST